MRTSLKLNVGSKTDSANICTPRPNESGAVWPSPHSDTQRCTYWCQLSALQATISGLPRCKNPSTFWLCFPLFVMVLGSILLTSFFLCFTSLVSITGSYTGGWDDISLYQARLRSNTTFLLMEERSVDLSRPHWRLFLAASKLKALWSQTPVSLPVPVSWRYSLLIYNSSYLLCLKNHQSKKVPATNMTERQ